MFDYMFYVLLFSAFVCIKTAQTEMSFVILLLLTAVEP